MPHLASERGATEAALSTPGGVPAPAKAGHLRSLLSRRGDHQEPYGNYGHPKEERVLLDKALGVGFGLLQRLQFFPSHRVSLP